MDRREIGEVIDQTVRCILRCDLIDDRFIVRIHLSTLEQLVSSFSYLSVITKFQLTAPWLKPSPQQISEFYSALNSLLGYGL